mmetsp:Transcript_26340/g.61829  ORF Transcript_26340/g.61829 Transcript_26340/m.61829 type:complete len:372 (-) Transcript_26340:359-1474(-)
MCSLKRPGDHACAAAISTALSSTARDQQPATMVRYPLLLPMAPAAPSAVALVKMWMNDSIASTISAAWKSVRIGTDWSCSHMPSHPRRSGLQRNTSTKRRRPSTCSSSHASLRARTSSPCRVLSSDFWSARSGRPLPTPVTAPTWDSEKMASRCVPLLMASFTSFASRAQNWPRPTLSPPTTIRHTRSGNSSRSRYTSDSFASRRWWPPLWTVRMPPALSEKTCASGVNCTSASRSAWVITSLLTMHRLSAIMTWKAASWRSPLSSGTSRVAATASVRMLSSWVNGWFSSEILRATFSRMSAILRGSGSGSTAASVSFVGTDGGGASTSIRSAASCRLAVGPTLARMAAAASEVMCTRTPSGVEHWSNANI